MNQIEIAARINAGLAVAARILGGSMSVYRPGDPLAPMGGAATILAGIVDRDPDRLQQAPPGYGQAARFLLADASGLQSGDILTDAEGTYFVASVSPYVAPMLVDCNATLQIFDLQNGAGYGGGDAQPVASGWPASVRLAGRPTMGLAGLPDDRRLAGLEVLLPIMPGVVLRNGMRAIDGTGRRLVLSTIETSALGYRIAADFGGS